jgi:hypothetical protein
VAQDEPKDAKSAVELARSAFEFRDFQKVIDVLGPWVRPMRILEDDLKIEARSLVGVSLHLVGNVEEAKAEFGELLLLDPRHRLDPFVVPPEVVATFEAVRRELKPTLDRILKERGEDPDPEPPVNLKVLTTPHPAIAILPFGIPQFVMEEFGWGTAFALLETLGLGVNIASWIVSGGIAPLPGGEPAPAKERWVAIQYTGLAVALLAYAGNVLHSFILLNGRAPDVPATP